jgi:predicted DNA-binding mobile mystery protein A
MTTRQLAARMGAAPSRIPAIEKAEVTGAITIKTLRQVAEAMNCTFVYTFVPTKPLDAIIRERAMQKTRADIARLDHSMKLENQALPTSDIHDEQQRMTDLILSGTLRGLWEDE